VEQTQIDGMLLPHLSVISFTLAWGISMVLLWFSSKASKSKKAQPSDKAYIGNDKDFHYGLFDSCRYLEEFQ
jgi:hypothetical protein